MQIQINADWTVVRRRVQGEPEDLTRMLSRYPKVPKDFVALARTLEEYELKHAMGQYFRIYAPSTCLKMDDVYGITTRIPSAIPIGDDGGDVLIVYADGPEGAGLYRVPFGALSSDELRFIASSLSEVLVKCYGVMATDIW